MNTVSSESTELWLLELGRHVPDAVRNTAKFELEGQTAAFTTKEELGQFAARYGYTGSCWHVTRHEITDPPANIVAEPNLIDETASNENSERLKEFAQ